MAIMTLNELSHIAAGYSEERLQQNRSMTFGFKETRTIYAQSEQIAYRPETQYIKLILETLSESNTGVRSLDIQPFTINAVGDELIFTSAEENQPLRVELIFIPNRGILRFSLHFNYDIGNVIQLLRSIEFIDSFNTAKKLRIMDVNEGRYNVFDIPPETQFQVDQLKFAIVKALAAIQVYTGNEFTMPERLSKEELMRILILEKMIESGLMLARPIGVKFGKHDALKLVEMYMDHNIVKDSIIKENYQDKILGKDIVIRDLTLDLATVRPDENLINLHKRISENRNEVVQINFIDGTKYLLNYIHNNKELPDNDLADAIEEASKETRRNFKMHEK
jgi:hypothetical protein